VRSLRKERHAEPYRPALLSCALSPSCMEHGMKENDAQDGQGAAAVDMPYPALKLHEGFVSYLSMADLLGESMRASGL
jgi:hypothetical protein